MRISSDSLSAWLPLSDQSSWVVRTLICSTLVIAATWIVVLAARRKSAAIRHRIFSLGCACLIIVPAMVAATEGLHPMLAIARKSKLDIAINSHDSTRDGLDSSFMATTRGELVDRQSRVSSLQQTQPVSDAMFVEPQNAGRVEQPVKSRPDVLTKAHSAASQAIPRQQSQFVLPRPEVTFIVVWATGCLLLLIKLFGEWLSTRNLFRNAVLVTDLATLALLREVRQLIERQAGCQSTRPPRLLCGAATPVPIALGILAPAIVLPTGFGKWTSERLRVVLMHELTHLNRRDILTNLVGRVACILYWFNPLVWLAARRMSLERELACDDSLLGLGQNPERYASDLVEIASALKPRLALTPLATLMATPSNLKIRVAHLMDPELDRRLISTRLAWLTTAMAGMALILLAVVSPSIGIAQDVAPKTNSNQKDTSVTLSGEITGNRLDALEALPNLQKLTIRNPSLQNFDIARLSKLKNLTEFSAEDFPIDSKLADIVAEHVAGLPRLKSLQFHRTGLTGSGLRALGQSRTSELILDGEELLTDVDFKHLAALSALSDLVVDSTPIEAEGLTALQACGSLRRLALRRHPAGSYGKGCESRIKVIANFKQLEDLELCDTGYQQLVALKPCKSLRRLTLHSCGGPNAAESLKQLTQLKRIEFDNTGFWKESFENVKAALDKAGISFADITQPADDLVARGSMPPDEATQIARHALEALDVGQQFPSFWIAWHQQWSKIPTMTAEPVRSIHRMQQALKVAREIQPWQDDITFAYAPGQVFVRGNSLNNDVQSWQQITYGDAKLAWSREAAPGQPTMHVLRNGVKEFEDSLGHRFPRQLYLTQQHLWWEIPTDHNMTSSSVSPQKIAYRELPETEFAGEPCRVFEGPGRSERLWVSKATGRLRGALHYIHQGYFTPFYQQDIVTKLVGRRVGSQDDYATLLSGPSAVSAEVRQQLSQAWSEHEFQNAYPGTLSVLEDYREIIAGKWFPFKVISVGWHHNQENESKYGFNVSESLVSEVLTDRKDLKSYWAEVAPGVGDKIQDQRYGVAVDYSFDRNRGEAEIQKLVNDRLLEFARSAILIEDAQSPFKKLVGSPAPEIPAAGWVGERPDLKGKRYLLHFWAAWCGPCKNDVPLLNAVAKNRIVIGVHPADTSIDKVRESMKESGMKYPTVVAPRDAGSVLGYPVKMFPYCVEVDEQGRVANHGFLNEVLQVDARNLSPANPSTHLSGSILATDDKNALAVISLGEADGLQAKQLLDVVREGKRIAQLRVMTLSKNRCVGKAIDPNTLSDIKIGDKVQ